MNFLVKLACSSSLSKFNNLTPFSSALVKNISSTNARYCEAHENQEEKTEKIVEKIDPAIDRTKIIPVETSIRYLKSAAYKETYGDQAVWVPYRRNHKGLIPPRKTRKTCIRKGKISTGNPCPICRDEYLVLHHENTDLLHQFISPQNGKVISYSKTGLCQKKHLQLLLAVERAKDHGRIVYDVPQRDYSEYYEHMERSHSHSSKETKINQKECSFLIIGGGIAGISCAETINFLAPGEKIIILTESSLIKSVTNLVQLGKYAQRFDIKEIVAGEFEKPNIQILTDELKSIKSKEKVAQTANGTSIKYKSACICTGARPKIVHSQSVEDFVIGIRDTDSVKEFQKRIKTGKKFVLIGNGGIASEIIYEIKNIQIEWLIKDNHMSSTFIDPGASKFFESRVKNKDQSTSNQSIVKRMRYMEERNESKEMRKGAALGPDWHRLIDMSGTLDSNSENIKIRYGTEVKSITRADVESEFPICVEIKSGEKILCDFVVSATGVEPYKNFSLDDDEFKLSDDGGIVVDEFMRTSVNSIYAAGDICTAGWEHSKFWHQMRLWTQARQMGMMAGKSMIADSKNEEIYQDFCFELFSHVTKLYGYQVVLLGRYNGQGLNNEYELLFRITPDQEYIKFVLKDGRLVGALLIGETGLEETCENLILNQIDLTPYGDDILNPNIDIEDYFD